MSKTILVTGIGGQVGWELMRSLQGLGNVVGMDRQRLDIAAPDAIRAAIREYQPALIVNPAAYTAVDKAEEERDLAMRVNGDAPGIIGEEARKIGAAVIHYSTDYVFDGAQAEAYTEADTPNPVNFYGQTKLAGERALAASGAAHIIFRTSWVYGVRGKNFLLTMLRLGRERDELRVINDQHGAPTWSRTIADITAHVVAKGSRGTSVDLDWIRGLGGIVNLASAGETTWHGFAQAIFSLAEWDRQPVVVPIPTHEYPLPAKRPTYSRLSTAKLADIVGHVPHWSDALALAMADLHAVQR
jgi:dTDP-4-dehydrorhamnose reductase